MKRRKKAFTLVELIIVIAVIAVLAAILVIAMPTVIRKAKASSAVSDARNTVTHYENLSSEKKQTGEAVIIVKKYSEYYVYGYFKGELNASASNTYETNSFDALFTSLLDTGSVVKTGEIQENITSKLNDNLENVAVYDGYRLVDLAEDITLNIDTEYVGVEENYKTDLVIVGENNINEELIDWESSDVTVAEVHNGIITGMSQGDVTITARCGSKASSVDVKIIDYTDFDGTLPEMKSLIENPEIPLVMLKLTNTIQYVGGTDMLPINIENGIRVRIKAGDMSGGIFVYSNNDMYNFIHNSGSLWIKGNDNYDVSVSVTDRREGAGDVEMPSTIIVNDNGGNLEFDNITFEHMTSIASSSKVTAIGSIIDNIDGTVKLNNVYGYNSGTSEKVTFENPAPLIRNGEKGKLTATDSLSLTTSATCIENYGYLNITLKKVNSYNLPVLKGSTPIDNYGQINKVQNIAFESSGGICIASNGKKAHINLLENVVVNNTAGHPVHSGDDIPEYVLRFVNGAYADRIQGGEYSYSKDFIYADEASYELLHKMIVSGQFAKWIDPQFIADGHTQSRDVGMGLGSDFYYVS